jgi:hypothetical protein
MRTAFTVFDPGAKTIGKKFIIDGDGQIQKIQCGDLKTGTFQTVECDWQDFGKEIAKLKPGQPVCYGTCNRDGVGGKLKNGRLVSSKFEASEILHGKNLLDKVARTKRNFDWSTERGMYNVLFLDVDYMSDAFGSIFKGAGATILDGDPVKAMEIVLIELLEVYPFLATLEGGCWGVPSASAYIYDKRGEGSWHSKLSGVHFYFALPTEIEIEAEEGFGTHKQSTAKIKDFFVAKTWLAGKARYDKIKKITGYARSYVRGPIDLTVWQNQRLDFISRSVCEVGLEQRRPEITWFDSFDCEVVAKIGSGPELWTLTPDEKNKAEVLQSQARIAISTGIEKENEKCYADLCVRHESGKLKIGEPTPDQFKRLITGEIPLDLTWQPDTGPRIGLWELLLSPEKFHKMTGEDPFEPEWGKSKCQFYYNKESDSKFRYVLHSFLHGETNYALKLDAGGVRAMVASSNIDALKARLEGCQRWFEDLARVQEGEDYETIIGILEDAGLGKPSEIRAMVNKSSDGDQKIKRLGLLEQVNERFGFVSIEGTARFIELFEGQRWKAHREQSFKLLLQNWGTVQTFNPGTGKYASEDLFTAWNKWSGRREFDEVRFEPTKGLEFVDEARGARVLNYYRGMACERTVDRACGKKLCGGGGCFSWFFAEVEAGRSGICPAGWGEWKSKWDSIGAEGNNKDTARDEAAADNLTYWCKTILDTICAGDINHARWTIDWFADIIQAPGGRGKKGRAGTCVGIRGAHGAGKNMIIGKVGEVLGKYYMEIAGKSDLGKNFNAAKEYCLLMHGVEAANYATHGESEILKSVITDDMIRIEPKNIDAYFAKNHIRVVLSSNADKMVLVAQTERRFTIFETKLIRNKNRKWFERVKETEPGGMLDEMLSWKIESNIYAHLETEGLRKQKEMSMEYVEEMVLLAAQNGLLWDDDGVPRAITGQDLAVLVENEMKWPGAPGAQALMRKMTTFMDDRGVKHARHRPATKGPGSRPYIHHFQDKDTMVERIPLLNDGP